MGEGDGFAIDRERVQEDAKFDGVFVLQTNAHLSPLETMLVYKQLWTVDIDQSWRLSRINRGGWSAVGGPRRQAAPGRRGGADRLQFRDRLGVGAHEQAAFRAGADVAA